MMSGVATATMPVEPVRAVKPVVVVGHPFVQSDLTIFRDKRSDHDTCARVTKSMSKWMIYEAMRDMPTIPMDVETPLAVSPGCVLGAEVLLVPVLRAGLVMADGIRSVIKRARVGHIGMFRNEETLEPQDYYKKIPGGIEQALVILLDPMLATGGSADTSLRHLKAAGAQNLFFLCLVAAPEGIKRIQSNHPDVTIYTAAKDEKLNKKGYIVPGLGDAGDRLFGTA